MDVNNAALELFISLRRRFKHSDFHTVKNSIRDVNVFGGDRLQLVKGTNQIIQSYQVMAESQIVNQVTLGGGKKKGRKKKKKRKEISVTSEHIIRYCIDV